MAAIGIAFGHSSIRAAFLDENGEFKVIEDENGRRLIPSVVAFDGKIRLFGEEAVSHSLFKPESAIYGIKRLLGRSHDFNLDHSCVDVNNEQGRLKIRVNDGISTKEYSSEEIVASLFDKIKEMAESNLGTEVKKAVISVATYFTHNQRQAIINAASIADIEVLRLVNDSTAVAVSHSYKPQTNTTKTILVVDFGGGSLDVSLIEINKNVVSVLCSSGSTTLGGADFTNRLMNLCIQRFKEQFQVDVSSRRKVINKLRILCEKAKISIETRDETKIAIDAPVDGKNLEAIITAAEFEELCGDLFAKFLECLDTVFIESGVEKSEIFEVLLVGGASRMKKIQQLLFKFFGPNVTINNVNCMDSVVNGAAILASQLVDDSQSSKFVISERNYFNVAVFKVLTDDVSKTKNSMVDVTLPILIDRLVPIPASTSAILKVRKQFDHANEAYLEFNIVINDMSSIKCSDQSMCVRVDNLSPSSRKNSFIEIELRIDENGAFLIKVFELLHDDYSVLKKQMVSATFVNDLSDEEILELKKNLKVYKKEAAEEERRLQCRNDCERQLLQLKQLHDNLKPEVMAKDEISVIAKKLAQMLEAIESCGNGEPSEYFEEIIVRAEELRKKMDDVSIGVERDHIVSTIRNQVTKLERRFQEVMETITSNLLLRKEKERLNQINEWLSNCSGSLLDECANKLIEVNTILQQLDSFVLKDEEMRLKAKFDLLAYLSNLKSHSPFQRFEKLELFSSLQSELDDKIKKFEGDVNYAEFPSMFDVQMLKADLDDFIQEKLSEFSAQEKEARGAKRIELQDVLRNFRQQYLPDSMRVNYKEGFVESLKKTLTAIDQWCLANGTASVEDFNKKIQEVKDLIEVAEALKKQVEDENAYVGIDIGTAFCRLCIVRNGQYEVVTFGEGLPSLIALDARDEIRFGNEAKHYLLSDSKNTFYNVKRLIGRKRNSDLDEELRYVTYFVNMQLEKLLVYANNWKKQLAIEEITALLLLKMKMTAEEYLKKEINEVTISVPSIFCNSQRQSTHDAAIIAGFKKVKLLNDTVAITLRHIWDNLSGLNISNHGKKNMLVFSMGAGFTSVTLVEEKDGHIDVKAHGGKCLGGFDFDKSLYELTMKKLGLLNKSLEYIHAMECEKPKIALSSQNETIVVIGKNFGKHERSVFVKRSEFEDCCRKLFEIIFNTICDTIKAANIDRSDIDEVIVCGGCTQIPKVTEFLKRCTPSAVITRLKDDSVAIGCAIQSMISETGANVIKYCDRSNYSYCLEGRNNEPIVIQRYSNLPAASDGVIKASVNYQHTFTTYLYELAEEKKILICDKILQTSSSGILKDQVAYKVHMRMDKSGLLSVTAIDSGTQRETTFYVKSRLSEAELERMMIDFQRYRHRLTGQSRVSEEKKKLMHKIEDYRKLLGDVRKFIKRDHLIECEKALANAYSLINDDRCTAEIFEASTQRLNSVISKILVERR